MLRLLAITLLVEGNQRVVQPVKRLPWRAEWHRASTGSETATLPVGGSVVTDLVGIPKRQCGCHSGRVTVRDELTTSRPEGVGVARRRHRSVAQAVADISEPPNHPVPNSSFL